MADRLTQASVEVVVFPNPTGRLTQASVEVIQYPNPPGRLTQASAEVIVGSAIPYRPKVMVY